MPNAFINFQLLTIAGPLLAAGTPQTVRAEVQHNDEILGFDGEVPANFVLKAEDEQLGAAPHASYDPIPIENDYELRRKARQAEFRNRVIVRELAWQALSIIDAAQTIRCLKREDCTELNPLLGSQPKANKIIAFKSGAAIAHLLITRALYKRGDERGANSWQLSTLGVQGVVVTLNFGELLKK